MRQVSILGVDPRFWANNSAADVGTFWQSEKDEVALNATLAAELGVGTGDTVAFSVQKVSAIPRETLLGRREASEVVDELRLTVRAVLPREGPGQFSLNPSAAPPGASWFFNRMLANVPRIITS